MLGAFLGRAPGVAWAALLLLFCAVVATAQNPVIFEDRGPGSSCRCVELSECPSLNPAPGQRLTNSQRAELHRARCGFVGLSIKVCCPDESPLTTTETVTSPTPPSSNSPTPAAPTALPQNCGQSSVPDRIIGGTDTELGAHPWIVAIGYRVTEFGGSRESVLFSCGGSLVTVQHVVTAAHCVHPSDLGGASVQQLNVGEWKLDSDPDCVTLLDGTNDCAPPVVVRQPGTITWHPQYNTNGNYNNDIALIRMTQPVTLGAYIQPICIPRTFDPTIPEPDSHPRALATGWGATEESRSSAILQGVRLPFVDIATCNASYRGLLFGNQVCAGGIQGQDSCGGDSGGPLITTGRFGPPYRLVGLTSFGRTLCGSANNYGVYTLVPVFRSWIEDTLRL